MGSSIQDYLKKINTWLSFYDSVSLGATTLILVIFSLYIHTRTVEAASEVTYISNTDSSLGTKMISSIDSRPFASRKGKTYTYSWCSGSGRISQRNKIVFNSEAQAIASGRTLSKLCKKRAHVVSSGGHKPRFLPWKGGGSFSGSRPLSV